jgi:DNA-binding PadR family transcriptional regulator
MVSFRKKVLKAVLPHIILERLSEKPMHGYALIVWIRKRYGVYLGPSEVYPVLKSLEGEGCLESRWAICNGRAQRVYSLTAKGRLVLDSTSKELSLLVRPQLEVEA